jgi:hypothetical protein
MNDTDNDQTSFMQYWEAVDAAMLKLFGIDTSDAGIDAALIAGAQEQFQTPEEFAQWYGEKHDLTYLDDWKTMQGMPTPAFVKIVAKDRDNVTKAAHTPGAWFPSDEDNQIRANTADGHTTICEMWSTDSDARLIAAAPELLQALKALHQLITHETDLAFHVANVYARLVIAKAEGGAI